MEALLYKNVVGVLRQWRSAAIVVLVWDAWVSWLDDGLLQMPMLVIGVVALATYIIESQTGDQG